MSLQRGLGTVPFAVAVISLLAAGQAQAQCRGGQRNVMRQQYALQAQLSAVQPQLAALQQQYLLQAQLAALQQQYALQAQLYGLQQNALLAQTYGLTPAQAMSARQNGLYQFGP